MGAALRGREAALLPAGTRWVPICSRPLPGFGWGRWSMEGGRKYVKGRGCHSPLSSFLPFFEIRALKRSCHSSSLPSAPRAAVLHAASWSAVIPAESKCLPAGHYAKWLTSVTRGSFFPSISLNQLFCRQHFLSANNSHHGGWQDGCFLLCFSFSSFALIFSYCFSLLFVFFVLTTTAISTIICLCVPCPQEIFSPLFPCAISWSFPYFFHFFHHLLLPLFHHPASPSHTLLPHAPGPASAAGCVVLVEKSLSLPGPTSTWDLFCHSVPFICWLKLEAYGNKGTQITHMILPPPPFRPWVGVEGCLHPCPALTTLAAFDNGSRLQYLVLALCKMGAVLQTAWV